MASTGAAPRQLSYAEARRLVLAAVPVLPAETVPLSAAPGRALARTLRAPHPLPPFTNSSMDGYAVRASDLERASPAAPVELPVVEVLPAGRTSRRSIERGEAARIMTGAALPDGADSVVPFEDCERLAFGSIERVQFTRPVSAHAHVREAGADLEARAVAAEAGRRISPHDVALLGALGFARLEVGARPRVTVLSTGDELLGIDEPLRPGAIRDSNVPMLAALLAECGCEVLRSERLPDREREVGLRIRSALEEADAVLTVGGVSAGDFDPVKQAIAGMDGAELWRVAMKPGRPQAFGIVDGRLFHALPGNPASVACVFEALTRPALRRMAGFAAIDRPRIEARAAEPIDSRVGRTDFVRVTLETRGAEYWARPAGEQVSGHLVPQARAHALLVVSEERAVLAEGDRAEALLLRWPEDAAG